MPMSLGARIGVGLAAAVLLLASCMTTPPERLAAKPVMVAVMDRLPYGDGLALVVRYAGGAHDDVIVLMRDSANPMMLAAALISLERRRSESGSPQFDEFTVLESVQEVRGALPSKLERVLNSVLRRLSAQPPVQHGGLGTGQWLRFYNLRTGR